MHINLLRLTLKKDPDVDKYAWSIMDIPSLLVGEPAIVSNGEWPVQRSLHQDAAGYRCQAVAHVVVHNQQVLIISKYIHCQSLYQLITVISRINYD